MIKGISDREATIIVFGSIILHIGQHNFAEVCRSYVTFEGSNDSVCVCVCGGGRGWVWVFLEFEL
jgi:hypothetical protein